MDTNRLLPPELRVRSAGSHMYIIGLSLYGFGSQKRHFVHKPILVFIISLHMFLRNLLLIILPEMDARVYLLMGDFPYFTGMRLQCNFIVVFVIFIFNFVANT